MKRKDGGPGDSKEVLYSKKRAERVKAVGKKYKQLNWAMDERMRRLWAGSEAIEWGRGGLAGVVKLAVLS